MMIIFYLIQPFIYKDKVPLSSSNPTLSVSLISLSQPLQLSLSVSASVTNGRAFD
jgi:hypothetical protein